MLALAYVSCFNPLSLSLARTHVTCGLPPVITGADEVVRVEGNAVRIPQKPGWVFGDVALLFNSPRTASVVAATDVVLWAMDRGTFLKFVMRYAQGARALRFVRKVWACCCTPARHRVCRTAGCCRVVSGNNSVYDMRSV